MQPMAFRLIGSPKRVVPFVRGEQVVGAVWREVQYGTSEVVVVEVAEGLRRIISKGELERYAFQVPFFRLETLPLPRVRTVTSDASLTHIEAHLRDSSVGAVAMCEGDRMVALAVGA
jgi:hypothetical protein